MSPLLLKKLRNCIYYESNVKFQVTIFIYYGTIEVCLGRNGSWIHVIHMRDIIQANPHKTKESEYCMKIRTKSGTEYIYDLGAFGDEYNKIIELINKQVALKPRPYPEPLIPPIDNCP